MHMFVRVHVYAIVHSDQRATCRCGFYPFTMWVLGNELRSSILVVGISIYWATLLPQHVFLKNSHFQENILSVCCGKSSGTLHFRLTSHRTTLRHVFWLSYMIWLSSRWGWVGTWYIAEGGLELLTVLLILLGCLPTQCTYKIVWIKPRA